MDVTLSEEELRWLKVLHTDSVEKPQVPPAIADTLVQHGLAIPLVEGGLQLTSLGRDYLEKATSQS